MRTVTVTTCRACGAVVWQGWDADTCALLATVDPATISIEGETQAVTTGRRTYNLHRSLVGAELSHRDVYGMTGPRKNDVAAEHRCGAPPLPTMDPRPVYQPKHNPDQPPY